MARMARQFITGELVSVLCLASVGRGNRGRKYRREEFALFALAACALAAAQDADAARVTVIALDPAPLFQFVQVANDAGIRLEAFVRCDFSKRRRETVLGGVAADERRNIRRLRLSRYFMNQVPFSYGFIVETVNSIAQD